MTKNNSLQSWKENALRELKKQNIEAIVVETPEGINIKPLYTELDNKEIKHLGSNPGEAPYVRGPKATMYTGRPWTIRQYAGFSRAEESNAFYKKNLENIKDVVKELIMLPTYPGYDKKQINQNIETIKKYFKSLNKKK